MRLYIFRQDVVKYQVDGQIEVIQKYSEELLNEVVKYFDEKIRTCEGGLCMVSEKMQYIVTRDELKVKLFLQDVVQLIGY